MSTKKRRRSKEKQEYETPEKKQKESTSSVIIKNADAIFNIEIIRHQQIKLGARGRKTIDSIGRYKLTNNVKVTNNSNATQYQCSAEMDLFTLSSNAPLSVEISLKLDGNIYSESEQFNVPPSEKLNYIDNGIFCSCGETDVEAEDYHPQVEPVDTKQNKSNLKCVITIHQDSIRINDGNIEFSFNMSGVDKLNSLVVNQTDEDIDQGTEWISCDSCSTWQHVKCLQWDDKKYDTKISTELHYCPLLCSNKLYGLDIKSLQSKYLTVIDMIADISKYKRKSKVKKYKEIFMKNKSYAYKDKVNVLKKYTHGQLELLACNIGINIECSNKNDSIKTILNTEIFEQTSPALARFLTSIELNGLDKKSKLRIAEFGCGNGRITKFIAEAYPNSEIFAFDINGDRIAAAKTLLKEYKNIVWVEMNVIDIGFIDEYIDKDGFDLVIANPPFEYAFQFIYIGLQLVKSRNGKLSFLLPESYFGGQSGRRRLARMLKINIIKCYHMGAWNYYKTFDECGNINEGYNKKQSDDAIWIMESSFEINVSHKYHDMDNNTQPNKISAKDRLAYISIPFHVNELQLI